MLMVVEESAGGDVRAAQSFLEGVDRWLAERNIVYAALRADGILGAPRLASIPAGSWERCALIESKRRGNSEAQFKHAYLALDESFLERFPRREQWRLRADCIERDQSTSPSAGAETAVSCS